MARAAFLMDKLMSRCGLSGKSFIPLLSSMACAVPGIMAARVIEQRRDRLATILVAPLMSCSARLPVYTLLIGAFLSPQPRFAWWVPGVTLFCLYLIGLIVAPLVALALKRTLLRGETPVFVMEMPLYKWPAWRTVVQRMTDSSWMFVRRAGTIILASMIVVWSLLYFPSTDPHGQSYDRKIAEQEDTIKKERAQKEKLEQSIARERKELKALEREVSRSGETESLRNRKRELLSIIEPVEEQIKPLAEKIDPVEEQINAWQQEWIEQSYLGRFGRWVEPAVEPLGWDWRIGTAALASFPAREVMVGTMGIIYGKGKVSADEIREAEDAGETDLARVLRGDDTFNVPVALSVMVFFALCCQCASTLAVIKRETNSWRWPILTFVYMTVLAYLGALLVYQVGSLFL
jgi:ferrous iron transport protein B